MAGAAPAALAALAATAVAELEAFELELIGGGTEKRYRRMRPEVLSMPWDSFDPRQYDEEVLVGARSAWTRAAFQEHRTAAACAATLRALIEARAPLDLIAVASRFPLDEMVHVELCARMAMLLGGGTDLKHDPANLIIDADTSLTPLVRAVEMTTRFFCVGEALSIPLLRGAWHAAKHPLPKAILGRIVRDEAAHGSFGFTVLDWAWPALSAHDRAVVGEGADRAIGDVLRLWEDIRRARPPKDSLGNPLGWFYGEAYLALAQRSLREKVLAPLRERQIPISAA